MTKFLILILLSPFSLVLAEDIGVACVKSLGGLPGKVDGKELAQACSKVKVLSGCQSAEGDPIFYYEKKGTAENPKKIFAKALIHGDEIPSGVVARAWMTRLEKIDPRNTWRIVPLANPDGLKQKTRYNSKGVDLNRNFPTADWENEALKYWKEKTKSDKRRYPGPSAASEIETQCLLEQFEDFNPDFIISIHTPLGVLDFDGPQIKNPPKSPLAWNRLGNFPGSLGRHMWKDRNVPVLTIELKPNHDVDAFEQFDRLQDISGTVAIQADLMRAKEKSKSTDKSAANN